MKRLIASHRSFFALVTVFGLGCAAQVVTTHAISAAQSDPAQGVYRECFQSATWVISPPNLNEGELPEMLTIPAGWHVVGGGPGGIILCR